MVYMQQLIYLFSISLLLSTPTTTWFTHYPSAISQAKTEKKPVLMVFSGSDWCRPCIMMEKEVFETPVFQQYADSSLVLLKVDFPRKKKNLLSPEQQTHNDALAAKYNSQGHFPSIVLLSTDGTVLAQTAYMKGGATSFIQYLETELQKSHE